MSDTQYNHISKKKEPGKSHPPGWTQSSHYGMCGQSCPCCRAKIEETPFGVCQTCWEKSGKGSLPRD
jgi:hypothetical protein